MNQILITKKIYITPELKKKKKMYKINFMLSIFLIFSLFVFYAYKNFDRNKYENISKAILDNMYFSNDDTTINQDDDIWIIAIDGKNNHSNLYNSSAKDVNETTKTTSKTEKKNDNVLTKTYTDSNGKKYTTLGTINIPSINVNYPILSETSDEWLKISVCKFWGSNPNEIGNLCIAGHNYRNTRFFSKVPTLSVGDIIEIEDLTGTTLKYSVYDKFSVDPNDVSCTSQLTNGKKIITLITCSNDSKQRIIIKAEETT